MSRPIDMGLGQIKTLLIKMGRLSADSIDLAMKGFLGREDVYVQIRSWSNTVLILSEEVEDRATELMALHQPMARDLRMLKAYIKIAYDIERFGRYALDVSHIMGNLGPWEPLGEDELPLVEAVKKVLDVVNQAVRLIETQDQALIWNISKLEAEVDDFYLDSLRALAGLKKCSPLTLIAYTLTVRYLERIADHASYIAESMTYASTGRRITLR